MAAAYATLQVYLENDVVGHVARMQPVMARHMQTMLDSHPCVKQARNVGLFGCIDLQRDRQGTFLVRAPPCPPIGWLFLLLLVLFRWHMHAPFLADVLYIYI